MSTPATIPASATATIQLGGNMPPFSLEALSDDQLGDVLAYLEMFGLPQ